jgi:hypothetical protein
VAPGGRIQGRAWLDADGDRQLGASEAGIAGLKVRLDRITPQGTGSPVEDSWGETSSGVNGWYEFAAIPAGAYVVRLVTYGDLEPTTPPWVAVNVAEGELTYEVSFGLRQQSPRIYLPLITAR